MTHLIGPMVAVFGVLAAFVVIRGRARTRRNLYASLRADRERRIQEARERALAPPPTYRPDMALQPARVASSPSQLDVQLAPPDRAVTPPPAPLPAAPTPTPRPKTPLPEPPTRHTPYARRLSPDDADDDSETWHTPDARRVSAADADDDSGTSSPARRSRPALAMTALSYASLAAALIVVALGVVLMIEASSH